MPLISKLAAELIFISFSLIYFFICVKNACLLHLENIMTNACIVSNPELKRGKRTVFTLTSCATFIIFIFVFTVYSTHGIMKTLL